MKAKETYLKGKSIFYVSLIVIGVTVLTVYLSGIHYTRTVTSNLYLSLAIIGICLFAFMSYGLYKGVGLIDNFPKYRDFETGNIIANAGEIPELPSIDIGEGIGGIILSIILWIAMTILVFILLVMLEMVFWFSLFVILMMLYWIFSEHLNWYLQSQMKPKEI